MLVGRHTSRSTPESAMSDYNCLARSNGFRVKDPEAFEAAIRKTPLYFDKVEAAGAAPIYVVYGESDYGWPTIEVEDGDGAAETSVEDWLSGYLAEGEVAVLMEAGFAGHQQGSVVGAATAVNASGKTIQVRMDDIYDRAVLLLGANPKSLTVAAEDGGFLSEANERTVIPFQFTVDEALVKLTLARLSRNDVDAKAALEAIKGDLAEQLQYQCEATLFKVLRLSL